MFSLIHCVHSVSKSHLGFAEVRHLLQLVLIAVSKSWLHHCRYLTQSSMAPEPTEMEEEVPSYSTDRDDVTAVVTSRILNLRFYPAGSGDEEDGDLDQLFEDSNEDNEFVSGTATGREKAVKFAEDIAEQREAHLDKERSRKELLTKINRLTDTLKDAEKALEVEREKRKKKERNLLKLAKELKKRNQKRDSDLERMEEVSLNSA